MANFTGLVSPLADTDEENVKSQLAYANALRKQSLDTGGQMVSGFYVPKSPWQNFIEGAAGGGVESYQREKQRGLEQAKRQERADFVNRMPGATTTQQYDPVANPGTGPLINGMEVAKDPRQYAQELQRYGVEAMNIPGMENMGGTILQKALDMPQRQAEMEEAAKLRRQQAELAAEATRQTKAEADARRAEELAKDRELKKTLAAMAASGKNSNADLQRELLQARIDKAKEDTKRGSAAQQAENIKQGNRQKMLDEALANIDTLTAKGGPLEKSTGSGFGELVDSAAGFFGIGTEGAKAAAQIEPLANPILMQVPRFEGPQSDADTKIYKAAAGQLGNTKLPVSVRMEAAKTIKKIMQDRKGQFGVKGFDDVVPGAAPAGPVDFGSLK